MSVLTSASTDTEVAAEYDNNASYSEDNSVAKARAFVTACRFLLRRRPAGLRAPDGRMMEFDFQAIKGELDEAKVWLESHSSDEQDAGPRVTRTDFRNFR